MIQALQHPGLRNLPASASFSHSWSARPESLPPPLQPSAQFQRRCPPAARGGRAIRGFVELDRADLPWAGPRSVRLGQLARLLRPLGISVPGGFVLTPDALEDFLTEAGLHRLISRTLWDWPETAAPDLAAASIGQAILSADLPNALASQLIGACAFLSQDRPTHLTVRSHFFGAGSSGMEVPAMEVRSAKELMEACRHGFASCFSREALALRAAAGAGPLEAGIAISVEGFVPAGAESCGLMCPVETSEGDRDVVLLSSQASQPLPMPQAPTSKVNHICDVEGGKRVKNIPRPAPGTPQWSLSDSEVVLLARWAWQIADFAVAQSGAAQAPRLQIDWGRDRATGQCFILDARQAPAISANP